MGSFGQKVEKLVQRKDVAGLIKSLNHEKESIRADAAQALGELGDTQAVEPLIRVLKEDDHCTVRHKAAEALERIGKSTGDSGAVVPLIRALKDHGEIYLILINNLARIGEPAVEPLIQALKEDKNPGIQSGAAWALERIGDSRAVEPLIQALEDERYPINRDFRDKLV